MIIDPLTRVLVGGAVAGAVAARAFRRRELTAGGAYAAFVVGTAAVAGGFAWGGALVLFFAASTRLTGWASSLKRTRSYHVLPDAGTRNAWQVFANGGWFAVAAILWAVQGDWSAGLFGFGSLATATADTWATEIGMAVSDTPRHLFTWQRVDPGTSGGVSLVGLSAALAGAFFIALLAVIALTVPYDVRRLEAVLIGGVAGSLADSMLGATLQSRRWCDQCKQWTERRVHTCGYRSRHARGFRWMTNDVVNFLAAAIGGLVAVGVAPR